LKAIVRKLLSTSIVCGVLLLFVPLVMWSFSSLWFYPDLWPQQWGVRAWQYVFGTAGAQILPSLGQSMLVAAVVAAISVAVGTPAGRALGLYDFRGKDLISVILLLPIIVPPLCVAMGLHLWFLELGLSETFTGVVLVHVTFCLPYTVFVMWGVFSNYDKEFEEQARSLGASGLKVTVRVMIPLISSGIIVAALFSFLLSWSQYLSTLIIGGGRITTLPVLLFALMGSGDRPVAAAVSLLFVIPAFLALAVSARHLGGKTLTGVW
jgi:putative spermidine/putrescine transport system permease protein